MAKHRMDAMFRMTKGSGYCGIPVGGDTYRGCQGGCLYCYDKQTRNQHIRKDGEDGISIRDYRALFKSLHQHDSYVRHYTKTLKCPVQLGILSDPFPPAEKKHRATISLLRLLTKAGIPTVLSTKAPHRIDDEHIEVLIANRAVVKVSFSTLSDETAHILEPHNTPPSNRIKHMRRLHDAGIPIVLRMDPFFYTIPYDLKPFDGIVDRVTMEFFRMSVTWRNSLPIELWEFLGKEKAPPPGDRRKAWTKRIQEAWFRPLQTPNAAKYGGSYAWVLMSPDKLRPYIEKMYQDAKAIGVPFGICNTGQGIHHVDLIEGGYCCQVRKDTGFDEWNLVNQWNVDEWDAFKCRARDEINLDIVMDRMLFANSSLGRPIADALPLQAGDEREVFDYE